MSNFYSVDSSQSGSLQNMMQMVELEEMEQEFGGSNSDSGMGGLSGMSLGQENPFEDFGGVNLQDPAQVALAMKMNNLQEQQTIDNIKLGGMQQQQSQLGGFFNNILQGDSQASQMQGATDSAGC